MKRAQLKPWVFKIKGAKNYALYDILNGVLYHLDPGWNDDELRKNLLEEGLIFETQGVVPFKLEKKIVPDKGIHLREVQIRINGRGEDTCWERNLKKSEKKSMDTAVLNILAKELSPIPIEVIRVETEDVEKEKIKKIIAEFKGEKAVIYSREPLKTDVVKELESLCGSRDMELEIGKVEGIDITPLEVDEFMFYYARQYNPCLGHKVAVDTGGEIKPCLWSQDVIGNINDNNIGLRDLIFKGALDSFWELTKNRIEGCKECELRFACRDCRASALQANGKPDAKPPFCSYDPFTDDSY